MDTFPISRKYSVPQTHPEPAAWPQAPRIPRLEMKRRKLRRCASPCVSSTEAPSELKHSTSRDADTANRTEQAETEMYRPDQPDQRQESAPSSVYAGSPLVLIGPTGVGKSSIGQALARQLRLPFVDSDQVIAGRYGAITEMFATLGEPAFRRIESDTIASLLSSQSEPTVLSVGGGAILDPATRELLHDLTVIWLDTELEYVLPRLLAQPNRPLLHGDVAEKWQRYASARYHLYEELADLRIDAREGSVEDLAATIKRRLLQRLPSIPDAPR